MPDSTPAPAEAPAATPTAEAPAHMTPPDASSITPEEGYVPAEVTNMFADEAISDAELRGDDVPEVKTEPEKSEDGKTADPPPASDKKEPEKEPESEAKAEAEDSPPEKAEEDQTKPPPNFVPLKALQEERSKRKELAQQLVELQEAVELLGKPAEGESKENEFTKLSDDELETLIEDDPQEALRYQVRLQKHQAKQKALNTLKQNEDLSISEAVFEIQQVIPDIYDENSDSATELADFAVSKGFNPDYLPLLTDPRTKIIAPDGKTKMVLGVGAASVISLLNEMKNSAPASEADIRTKLEQEITEQVTQKILAKMKGDAVPVSINDLPGAPEEIGSRAILTEAEMAKLPKSELDAYLRGD